MVKLYIGMDVHKSSISIALAFAGETEVVHYGKISGSVTNLEKIIRRIMKSYNLRRDQITICYEAGPCGFVIARRLKTLRFRVVVTAPSLIPTKPGQKVKTDKRDARKIADLFRAGQLSSIHIPDEKDEAIRDVCRARTDATDDLKRAKHRLGSFLLRNGHVYTGRSKWTEAHMKYLRELVLPDPAQKVVLEEYIIAIDDAQKRIARLTDHIQQLSNDWERSEMVKALQSFKGFKTVNSSILNSELGDITRFKHPRQLMGFLGVVPSENSSGTRRRQGPITKCGNSHARWALVEASQHYRKSPKVSKELSVRQHGLSREIKQLSWRAQNRLHKRYVKLKCRGLHENKIVVAVARELSAFIWELAMLVKSQSEPGKESNIA